MNRSILLTACSLLSALVGGCGSLADDTDRHEPIAILQGALTNPQSLPASNVRVSVIWNCGNLGGDMYRVSQDVKVEPVFPSRFRLELTEPPPAECLVDLSDAFKVIPSPAPDISDISDLPASDHADSPATSDLPAPPPPPASEVDPVHVQNVSLLSGVLAAWGTIAAYEDVNGNGKLDMVGPYADNYVDTVLGTNESLILTYFEGAVPRGDLLRDSEGKNPSLGYNLVESSESFLSSGDEISRSHDDGNYVCFSKESLPPLPNEEPAPRSEEGTELEASAPEVEAQGGMEAPEVGAEGEIEPLPAPTFRWLNPSTFFELTMSSDPRFGTMMCHDDSDSFGGASAGSGGYVNPAGGGRPGVQHPLPNTSGLVCSDDGLAYFYETCFQKGVCSGTRCTSTCMRLVDKAHASADWPCMIK